MSEEVTFVRGSENVFADLGFPNADEHLLKAQLVHKISNIMKEMELTQAEAARILGVKQPDVSCHIRMIRSHKTPPSVLPDISPTRGESDSWLPFAPISTLRVGRGACL